MINSKEKLFKNTIKEEGDRLCWRKFKDGGSLRQGGYSIGRMKQKINKQFEYKATLIKPVLFNMTCALLTKN